MRVAVVGVHGIGKYHLKWYRHFGCEAVAAVASSPETAAVRQDMLHRDFGFQGRCYSDLPTMLEAENVEAVSICSPAHLHVEHARACLEAGAHVLCEKPLLWDVAVGADDMLRQADRLVRLANERGRILALNTQYPACLPLYRELAGLVEGQALGALLWEMEIRDRGLSATDLWADLAAHPLSLLLELLSEQVGTFGDVEVAVSDGEVRLQFRCGAVDCRWRFAQVAGPTMRRSFGVNGRVVEFVSRRGPGHEVRTYLSLGERRSELPDMMAGSIQRFVDACAGRGSPLVDADRARTNLTCQIDLSRDIGLLG